MACQSLTCPLPVTQGRAEKDARFPVRTRVLYDDNAQWRTKDEQLRFGAGRCRLGCCFSWLGSFDGSGPEHWRMSHVDRGQTLRDGNIEIAEVC